MMPGGDDFEIRIIGSGTINGVRFSAEGGGRGNTGTGELTFGADFSDVPHGTDPFANLLSVLIIVTNVFGEEVGDTTNLMTLANGEFDFTQEISGHGVDARSAGRLARTGDNQLTWSSEAEGNVQLSQVSAVKPFDAVMIPSGRGKITEVLRLPVVEQGEERPLHAVRHFTFTPRAELNRLQLRRVTIEPRMSDRRVDVDIKSTITPFEAQVPPP